MNNQYREAPEHKEITQRTTRTEGMCTERHQNMRNLHRGIRSEAAQPLPRTEATQRGTRTEGIYTVRPQIRRNLHRTTRTEGTYTEPPEGTYTEMRQNRRNLHRATRRNLHREAPEPKEFTQ